MKGGMWLVVNIINEEKQKWNPSERIIDEKNANSVKRYESMRDGMLGGRAKMKEMDNKRLVKVVEYRRVMPTKGVPLS